MTPSPPQGGPRVLNHVRFASSPKSPRRSAAFIKGRCGNPKTLVTHYVLLNADITNPPTRAKGAKSPKGRDGQTGASLTARPLPSGPCCPAPAVRPPAAQQPHGAKAATFATVAVDQSLGLFSGPAGATPQNRPWKGPLDFDANSRSLQRPHCGAFFKEGVPPP